jgi:hypothetical protein
MAQTSQAQILRENGLGTYSASCVLGVGVMAQENLRKIKKRGTILVMSLLELQNQVEKLPVHDRVALMQHIRHTLSPAELETFWVEEAEQVVDLVDAGQMATFTVDELRKRRAARTTS